MKHLAGIISIIAFFLFGVLQPVEAVGKNCTPITSKSDATKCTTNGKAVCAQALSWCCQDIKECPPFTSSPASICGGISGDKQRADCQSCMNTGQAAWTAIGCIPTEPKQFIAKFLGFGIGIAGGIAFLLILFGGFQILTSAGNPEQLNGGKELVGSAVSGLLLIIFSIFLLRLIGYNILGIPGFG